MKSPARGRIVCVGFCAIGLFAACRDDATIANRHPPNVIAGRTLRQLPPPPPPTALPYVHPLLDLTPRHAKFVGAVRDPEVPPFLLEEVAPKYPDVAARARVSGLVLLDIVIETDGHVSAAHVLKGLPFGLTQAAVDAISQWKFRPGRSHGKAVRTLYTAKILMQPPAK